MRFDYTYLNPSLVTSGDTIIDTDSVEFARRMQYLVANGAPRDYSVVITRDHFLKIENANPTGELDSVEKGTIIWIDRGMPFATDAYLTYTSPQVALVEILKAYNKPVPAAIPPFNPVPPPAPTTNDWEAPGAPIGPPRIGQPGMFFDNPDAADNEFDLWTAPSGRQYQSRRAGYGFFAYKFWKLIGS